MKERRETGRKEGKKKKLLKEENKIKRGLLAHEFPINLKLNRLIFIHLPISQLLEPLCQHRVATEGGQEDKVFVDMDFEGEICI